MNSKNPKISLHINGLGRFGQQLLYHWLNEPKHFELVHLSDQKLKAHEVCELLLNHDRLDFTPFAPRVINNQLCLTLSSGNTISLPYYCGEVALSPDFGLADYWLECSGHYSGADYCRKHFGGNTKRVFISATSEKADKTLILGFNDNEFKPSQKVISYGSCTVNAFVPLASWVDENLGLLEADVNVIHNTPDYRIDSDTYPYRKSCTLEMMATKLLTGIRPENFHVNYTMIPFRGVSLLNLRFKTEHSNNQETLRRKLVAASTEGELRGLYLFSDLPYTAKTVLGKTENAIFNLSEVVVSKQNIRMSGFFDNENSAYRFYDLITNISHRENPNHHNESENIEYSQSQV